jgi:hypothetical protein
VNSMTVQNQQVRGPEAKVFPALLQKILPVVMVVASLEGCHSTSVSANSNSPLGPNTSVPQAPVVAPAGSVLRVRLNQTLDTERSRPGDRFTGVLDSPIVADGKEILPKGTIVNGHVLIAHPSGRLKGRAALSLRLDSCEFDGRDVGLTSGTVTRVSGRHRKRNWILVGGGSGTGALIGGLVAGPVGALAGAGSGAAAGVAGAAITGKKDVSMPAETIVGFTLKSPLVL